MQGTCGYSKYFCFWEKKKKKVFLTTDGLSILSFVPVTREDNKRATTTKYLFKQQTYIIMHKYAQVLN